MDARRLALVPVLFVLAVLPGATATAQEAPCGMLSALDDRCVAWVASATAAEKTDAQDFLDPVSIALDPAGARVYVAARLIDEQRRRDFLTLAYDTATGAELWRARWDGPAGKNDIPAAVATDGERVYVTGSTGVEGGTDTATLAYRADSGSLHWASVTAQEGKDEADAIALAAGRVHVAGSSWDSTGTRRFFAAALDASSGQPAWSSSVDVTTGDGYPRFGGLAVTPDAERVVISGSEGLVWEQETGPLGQSVGAGYTKGDILTTAFDEEGAEVWSARIDNSTGWGDFAAGVVVSADGSAVTVAGTAWRSFDETDVVVTAYDARSGERLWQSAEDRTAGDDLARASSIAASPAGAGTYVSGSDAGSFAAIAYDGSGGTRWASTVDTLAVGELPWGIAVSPDGTRLYLAGWAYRFITYTVGGWTSCDSNGNCSSGSYSDNESQGDYGTVALDASTGELEWTARYNEDPAGTDWDLARSVVAGDSRVFVTGMFTRLMGYGRGLDHQRLGTIAYDA